ncbi:hypothetical protein L484_000321 [Morus notabilis]|uniref:Uncharacterized protein n=1 Tax=Morus notabilis TaxID=981085 RepID=W9T1U4_9ROSA|nr:hypothetical protein L484_000321 [Morus notabilis]
MEISSGSLRSSLKELFMTTKIPLSCLSRAASEVLQSDNQEDQQRSERKLLGIQYLAVVFVAAFQGTMAMTGRNARLQLPNLIDETEIIRWLLPMQLPSFFAELYR